VLEEAGGVKSGLAGHLVLAESSESTEKGMPVPYRWSTDHFIRCLLPVCHLPWSIEALRR